MPDGISRPADVGCVDAHASDASQLRTATTREQWPAQEHAGEAPPEDSLSVTDVPALRLGCPGVAPRMPPYDARFAQSSEATIHASA